MGSTELITLNAELVYYSKKQARALGFGVSNGVKGILQLNGMEEE